MDVKGEALLTIPMFILKKFGTKDYERWLNNLSPEAKEIFNSPISKDDWFPLQTAMVDPTVLMCEMFFNKSIRGAWDCGRFSAEYGLQGIYKVLVKLSSPQILIKKAGPILINYYRPGNIAVTEIDSNHLIVSITEFPEMCKVVEYRIAGWIERALEICGSRNVTVNITKSLANNNQCTEYSILWRRKL